MKQAALTIGILLSFFPLVFAREVLVVEPARNDITLTGYTRSKTTITVSSEVSGKVLKINYEIGQVIGSKPFIEIDQTFINFQVEGLKQSLKRLGISLERSASRVKYLEKEFQRMDNLFKNQSTSEAKWDASAEELNQVRLEHETILQEKAVLEINLSELMERKRRHSIYAPQGWVVVDRRIEQGEIIGPQTLLGKVSDFQELVVPLSVTALELNAIKSLPAEFDAMLEDKPVKASVNWINPEFNEKTRKITTELIIKDYQGEKRGGLRFGLKVSIPTEGLLVPKAAVINRYENPRVTLKQTGKIINIIVLGETDENLIIAQDDRLTPGLELIEVQK